MQPLMFWGAYRGAARVLLGVAISWLVALPAQAAWLRVETERFVVYGQGSEKTVRDFVTKLTTYDWVLRNFHPATLDRKSFTKVQVFLLSNAGDLKRVRPGLAKYTQGFYAAMNEGVFAFTTKGDGLGADDVLFHEYAHHFMLENFPAAYPAWFVEGWAEYYMTTDITKDVIRIGQYNEARAYAIFNEPWLPWEEVLSKTTGETSPARTNIYYSQAWLLTHYMRSDSKRAAQLDEAIRAIAKGEDPIASIQKATGQTLAELNAALRRYSKLPGVGLKNPGLMPAMTVTALPASADDLLIDNMRLVLAQTYEPDPELLASVRRKAARHPGDALAERTLARAEFTMGDVAAGEAIMTRRLAAAPGDREDLLLAGVGQLMAGMRDEAKREARYQAARPFLIKAYQLDPADFRTLYAYTTSRSVEPVFPNDNDLSALREARNLAPAVQETSFQLGMALIRKGRREEAAKVLGPIINSPHAGRAGQMAKAVLNGEAVSAADLAAVQDDETPTQPPAPAPAR